MSISASLLIVLIVLAVTYATWTYWVCPPTTTTVKTQSGGHVDEVVGRSDTAPITPSAVPSASTPTPTTSPAAELVGGFSTLTTSELPKLNESEAFGLTPNPKDQADVNTIDEKRKFINCNDEPKSFLPPKKLTNSYDHDDDEGTYVYDRCHMDTKAHIPKRDKSRSVYQSIAGDLDFPSDNRGKMEIRVVSTIHENDGGYFNRRGSCIEDSPPRPA
jgi:hypothetical protein